MPILMPYLTIRNRPLAMLSVGQILAALVNVLYGKVIAMYIPPDQWGQYSLVLAAMMIAYGFAVTPTVQAFKAALTDFSVFNVVDFYGRMAGFIYIVLFGVFALVAVGYSQQGAVWGLVWVAATGQGIYAFGTNYLNFFGKHRAYSWLLVLYAVGNVVLFAVLVIGFDQRSATGLWQVLALLNSLFAGLAVWLSVRLTNYHPKERVGGSWFPDDIRQSYWRYVGPLVRLAVWSWVINYADRYLIRLYLSDAAVGQYTMGYSLGSRMLLVVAPLIAYLSPRIFQAKAGGQPSQSMNRLVLPYLKGYAAVGGVLCLMYWLSYKWVGRVLLSAAYEPAFRTGPMVATGYLFLTCVHLLEIKWYAYGLTRLILWHTVAGAVLNVGLNLVLIPKAGIEGAAMATLLGFLGQFLLAFWLFRWRGQGV